jgi:hypothetical protein
MSMKFIQHARRQSRLPRMIDQPGTSQFYPDHASGSFNAKNCTSSCLSHFLRKIYAILRVAKPPKTTLLQRQLSFVSCSDMAKRLPKRFILVVVLLLLLRASTLEPLPFPQAIRLFRTATSAPIPDFTYSINKTTSTSHDGKQFLNSQFHIPPSQSPKNNISAVLLELARCTRPFNKFTNHVRLPNHLYNISMSIRGGETEARKFWNPTIFALPSWSMNEYLIVTMVDCTNRGYRQNVLCEANICVPKHKAQGRDRICAEDDLKVLGSNGGLRCAKPPVEVDLPATPAKKCQGEQEGLADIAGFHDPRIFYSSRGEPILTVASQYVNQPTKRAFSLTNDSM